MILRAVPESGCVSELLNVAIRGMGATGCCSVAPLPLGAERVRPVGGTGQVGGSAGVSVTPPPALLGIPRKADPELSFPPAGRGAPGQELRAVETRPCSGRTGLVEWGAPTAGTETQMGGGDSWGSSGREPAPAQDNGRRAGGGFQGSPAVREPALTKREYSG